MFDPLELELQMVLSHHVGARNLGFLEEQRGFITTDLSLQPQTADFYFSHSESQKPKKVWQAPFEASLLAS